MVGSIVHQLTDGVDAETLKKEGLGAYYTDHGVGLEYIQIRIQINNWLKKSNSSFSWTLKNKLEFCLPQNMYRIKIVLSFSEI